MALLNGPFLRAWKSGYWQGWFHASCFWGLWFLVFLVVRKGR